MIVRWLGHAAFSIIADAARDGRLCVDPHAPGVLGGRFQLPPIIGPFDAIATTHAHEDHCAWRPALGTDRLLDTDQTFGPYTLRFRGVSHDQVDGRQMGWVRMLSLDIDGFRIVHAGDLSAYDSADIAWLGAVDLLLVPVGGTYTLDGVEAATFTRAVAPKWVVPMHGQDPAIDLPLAPTSDFIDALQWPITERPQLSLDDLPPAGQVVLLQHPAHRRAVAT